MPGCATLTTRAEPRLHAWLRKAPNSMAHATTARPCQRTHPDVRPCPAGTVFTRLKLSCIAAPPPGGGGDQTGTTSRPPIALYRGLAGTEAHSNGRTRVTPSRDATSQHLSGASTLALLQPPPLACSRVPDSTRVIANMRHRVELTGGGRLKIRTAADWTRVVREAGWRIDRPQLLLQGSRIATGVTPARLAQSALPERHQG